MRATFSASAPPPGGLAVASQSGAVGITILDHAARSGIGLSSFISLGNKADVSGNDLLSYWYDDPATRAVALYLESVGNPRRFARIARATARRKPVLVVKSGRTATGTRAGASHTAAAAAPAATVDALFRQPPPRGTARGAGARARRGRRRGAGGAGWGGSASPTRRRASGAPRSTRCRNTRSPRSATAPGTPPGAPPRSARYRPGPASTRR